MTKLKYHILIDCISFTCVMVLFSIIGAFLKWEIPTLGILVFFLITTLISLLMYFTCLLYTSPCITLQTAVYVIEKVVFAVVRIFSRVFPPRRRGGAWPPI